MSSWQNGIAERAFGFTNPWDFDVEIAEWPGNELAARSVRERSPRYKPNDITPLTRSVMNGMLADARKVLDDVTCSERDEAMASDMVQALEVALAAGLPVLYWEVDNKQGEEL